MEIRYKLYPYPVLSSYSNDYAKGFYATKVEIAQDGYDVRVKFISELTSDSILECISNGKAKYVYHIECAQTSYRKVVQTDQLVKECVINHDEVNGKVQICPFVVAVDDLIGYSSDDFHEDYEGSQFDIEAGCVMAVGKTIIVNISKNTDDLAKTPSIFNIVKNPDETCNQMLVDMAQRKIIIKLPINEFYSYKAISNTPSTQEILNTITVFPALIYVLEELKNMSPQERSENEDAVWYKVISKALRNQFDCDIESEEFNNQNTLVLAQKLINNPMTKAFHFLSNTFDIAGEEE